MSKRAILWAVVLIVAFASGFGVGVALWKYNAYDYILRHDIKLPLSIRPWSGVGVRVSVNSIPTGVAFRAP